MEQEQTRQQSDWVAQVAAAQAPERGLVLLGPPTLAAAAAAAQQEDLGALVLSSSVTLDRSAERAALSHQWAA